jgi:hypothetical protein
MRTVLAEVISIGERIIDDGGGNEGTVDVAVTAWVVRSLPVLKT